MSRNKREGRYVGKLEGKHYRRIPENKHYQTHYKVPHSVIAYLKKVINSA